MNELSGCCTTVLFFSILHTQILLFNNLIYAFNLPGSIAPYP